MSFWRIDDRLSVCMLLIDDYITLAKRLQNERLNLKIIASNEAPFKQLTLPPRQPDSMPHSAKS